jgi:hypothetical protein
MAMKLCDKHQRYYRKICLSCDDMPSPANPNSYLSMMSDQSRHYWERLKKNKKWQKESQ